MKISIKTEQWKTKKGLEDFTLGMSIYSSFSFVAMIILWLFNSNYAATLAAICLFMIGPMVFIGKMKYERNKKEKKK